jgi:hypothetical protein
MNADDEDAETLVRRVGTDARFGSGVWCCAAADTAARADVAGAIAAERVHSD